MGRGDFCSLNPREGSRSLSPLLGYGSTGRSPRRLGPLSERANFLRSDKKMCLPLDLQGAFIESTPPADLIWGLNASIAGLYVAVHRDRWRLISAAPFLDLYFVLCLSAGLYLLVDECRNTRMKW